VKGELPNGWVWTSLGDITDNPQYGWTTRASSNGNLHLLRTTDITSGQIDWDSVPFCEEEPGNIGKYLLEDGDIVISRAGSVGYSYLLNNPERSIFASYLIRFKPLINRFYISYFLRSPYYWEAISEKSIGIAMANVNASKLKQIEIPLPPLAEQQRIVNKIEELFTNLDKGIESLEEVKSKLKIYRQAILKYAMEGKLTEKWREENKDKIEPASALLEKKNNQDIILAKENIHNFNLPQSWIWTNLAEIIIEIKKINPRINPDNSFFYIDIASIDNKKQSIMNPKTYFGSEAPSRARQLIKEGDVLFSTVRTYLRNIAIVSKEFNNQVASTGFCVLRLRNGNSKWLFYLVQTDFFLNPLTEIQRGTNYPAVRNSDILSQIIPLPPLEEQKEIVNRIEKLFSLADHIEETVNSKLEESKALRQSILKKAFEGKLVPQDPNDEPAEILLEKIKMEKSNKGKAIQEKLIQ
jgi:type I restriction enzyme S subunit